MTKIRILYIRENLPGGTDNYCRALATLMSDNDQMEPLPVEDLPAVKSRLLHYYYHQQALREAISRADIVHINGYTAMGTLQALREAHRQHKRVVYTAHWHPFECLQHPLLGRLFFRFLMRPAVRRYADVVTTINNDDTRFFKTVHPRVLQIAHWQRPLPSTTPVERQPGMILFVGRADDPVKGLHHLYALPHGRYAIHIVGSGAITMRDDFQQHIGISDQQLAILYRQASLIVIPSKYEAFSYAALEALSCGTPVVMSDHVRIADYLEGITGYQVFRYDDTADFVAKVEATMGTRVDTAAVITRFSPDTARKNYEEVYLKIFR